MNIEEFAELERHIEDIHLRRGPFTPAWHRRLAALAELLAIDHRAMADKKEAMINALNQCR